MADAANKEMDIDSSKKIIIESAKYFKTFVEAAKDCASYFPNVDFKIDVNADGLLAALSTVLVFEATQKKSAAVAKGSITFPLGATPHSSNAVIKFVGIDTTGAYNEASWVVTTEFSTACKSVFEKHFGAVSSNEAGNKKGKAAWMPILAACLITAKEKDEIIYTKHEKFTKPNGTYRGLPFEVFAHSIGASVPPRYHKTASHLFGAGVDLRLLMMTLCNPIAGLKGDPKKESAGKLRLKLSEIEQRDVLDELVKSSQNDMWFYAGALVNSFGVLKPRLDHFANMPFCAYFCFTEAMWDNADFHGKWAFSRFNGVKGRISMYLPSNFKPYASEIFTHQTFKSRFEDLGIMTKMFGKQFTSRNSWQAPTKTWEVVPAHDMMCAIYSRLAKGSQTADNEGKVLQPMSVPAFQGRRKANLFFSAIVQGGDAGDQGTTQSTVYSRLLAKMRRVRETKTIEGQGEFLKMSDDTAVHVEPSGVLFLNQMPIEDDFEPQEAPRLKRKRGYL